MTTVEVHRQSDVVFGSEKVPVIDMDMGHENIKQIQTSGRTRNLENKNLSGTV